MQRRWIASGQKTEAKLAPELEAIATTACEQLRAKTGGDPQRDEQLQRGVGDAAGRAIAAGLSLTAIAEAERLGHARAREQLGTEVLRAVERAAHRKREAERTYEQAVGRAARLGLVQRDIAVAAHVANGTIRAVLTRAQPAVAGRAASTLSGATNDGDAEQEPSVSAQRAVVAEPTRVAQQSVAQSSSKHS
jgi:hypothetical protein